VEKRGALKHFANFYFFFFAKIPTHSIKHVVDTVCNNQLFTCFGPVHLLPLVVFPLLVTRTQWATHQLKEAE